jgi:hypothetical protein
MRNASELSKQVILGTYDTGMEDIRFEQDKDLYSDRDYFQYVAGGFNSFGIGSQVASISFGWNRNLHSFHSASVKRPSTDIQRVCEAHEVVAVGHVYFARRSDEILFDGIQEELDMDGAKWTPALMCTHRLNSSMESTNHPTAIVYFREEYLTVPKDWFESMPQPVNLFGEIFRVQMAGRSCIIKARAAGIVLGLSNITLRKRH